MSILKDNILTKRFLFPRKKKFENPFFIYSNGNKLSCIRFKNFENGKMLVVFHAGNELVLDYSGSFAFEIEKMGINLLLVEYPGYAMSSGESDVLSILDIIPDIVRTCSTPLKDMIVFGRSIGAVYAIDTVSKFPDICGLIIESGVADFYQRIIKRVNAEDLDCSDELLKTEIFKYFDNKKKLKNFKGRTLIMHAADDRIIETEQAFMNYKWANGPKCLELFELSTHKGMHISHRDKYFGFIADFVNKL